MSVAQVQPGGKVKELKEGEDFKNTLPVQFILTDKEILCVENRPLRLLDAGAKLHLDFEGVGWPMIKLLNIRLLDTWPPGWNKDDWAASKDPGSAAYSYKFNKNGEAKITIKVESPQLDAVPVSRDNPDQYVILKSDAYVLRNGQWFAADPRVGVNR